MTLVATLRLLERITVVGICATNAVRINLVTSVIAHTRLALPSQALSCSLVSEVSVFHIVFNHRVTCL